ncbi:MAG: hypothetical protein IKV36_02100 [Clostridia bacterium]|nr:hypothetical protein [Clostridia bacterium]
MEFNFETPLILRLRKIAHSKTMLWCGIMFAVITVLFAGLSIISFHPQNIDEHFYIMVGYFVFNALLSASFFTVFFSSRNKDTVLPTGGFTAAGIICLISILVLAAIYVFCFDVLKLYFSLIAITYLGNIFRGGSINFDPIISDFTKLGNIYVAAAFIIPVLLSLALALAFFSASSVARNNKPRKFFPIILAIISFVILTFFVLGIVYYMFIDGFTALIDMIKSSSLFTFGGAVIFAYYFCMFAFTSSISILCGCVGIGFAKASRRIK